jgi:hypothetical protein
VDSGFEFTASIDASADGLRQREASIGAKPAKVEKAIENASPWHDAVGCARMVKSECHGLVRRRWCWRC